MKGELETLCGACGLCCDGSLFGRVGLETEEVLGARKNHLHVLPSGKSFEQPCSALGAGEATDGSRSCAVYAERPRACQRFVCRLYERHRREGGPLEPRLGSVRRARGILAEMEASGRIPDEKTYGELLRLLEEDFARVSS
jgi:Fe-S-cluster containining protein